MAHGRKIAVIGLGYVGLPVAVAFARSGAPVIGFDIDPERIRDLRSGLDRTREVEADDLRQSRVAFTADAADLAAADFFIVTVPTPIDEARRPNLGALRNAAATVGKAMRQGAIVVFESTVYPGATEEDCIPVLEQASGLQGRPRLHGRLLARADQSGRHGAPLRDHQEGGGRPGRRDARGRSPRSTARSSPPASTRRPRSRSPRPPR